MEIFGGTGAVDPGEQLAQVLAIPLDGGEDRRNVGADELPDLDAWADRAVEHDGLP